MNWHLFLQITALVLLVLAAINTTSPKVNLMAAGLAFWLASVMF